MFGYLWRFGEGCDIDDNHQLYQLAFLSTNFSTFSRLNVKMYFWEDMKFSKNKFLVCAMANCLMEGKRDD